MPPYTPDTVFEQTKAIVTLLVSKGFKYFGTGGAFGFDTIASQAVLSVKETYSEVKLILVLPYETKRNIGINKILMCIMILS